MFLSVCLFWLVRTVQSWRDNNETSKETRGFAFYCLIWIFSDRIYKLQLLYLYFLFKFVIRTIFFDPFTEFDIIKRAVWEQEPGWSVRQQLVRRRFCVCAGGKQRMSLSGELTHTISLHLHTSSTTPSLIFCRNSKIYSCKAISYSGRSETHCLSSMTAREARIIHTPWEALAQNFRYVFVRSSFLQHTYASFVKIQR